MLDVRNIFNGLNLDDSYFTIGKDRCADALNITTDAIEGSNDKVITNITGNQIVNYSLPAGTNKVIGAFSWFPYAYIFVYNSNNHHSVLEFDKTSRTITKVFESLADSATDILNFTPNNKITSVGVYSSVDGKLLFFIDSLGRPTEMNILRFKAGQYTPVTRAIIDVLKAPPLVPISNVYDNDTTRRTNDLRNKIFRFKYRYVYDDNELSVCSPISVVPLPLNILDDTFTSVITNNNVIRLSVGSGAKNVKSVQVLMSFVNKTNDWSDFQLVDTVVKATNGIGNDTAFSYAFYNDSTYPIININESILLYDYVPDFANCFEIVNGNVLLYAGITEGLDRTYTPNIVNTISTIAAGTGGSVGNLDSVLTTNTDGGTFQFMLFTFSGIPAVGTTVTIQVRRKSDGVLININGGLPYTTVAGDTADTIVRDHLGSSISGVTSLYPAPFQRSLQITKATYEIIPGLGVFAQVIITPPSTTLAPNSIPTWLWSSQGQIAIQYFNTQGKTNGVLYNAKIIFPAYAENGSHIPLIPFINTKIYNVPPSWASTFTFLFTKEATIPFFWLTIDVNTSETDYIYFDVTNIGLNQTKNPATAQVLSYTFQDGDRLRLIRRMSDNTVFADTFDAAVIGLVVEPTINSVVQTKKTFIKIKKVAPFSTVDYTSKNFVIEVYRLGQQSASGTNQTYYECGREYPTLLDSNNVLVHGGEVTNQDTGTGTPAEFNFYGGDVYFRQRSVVLSETGSGTFNVMDRNFVDFYISAVNSIDGRPSVIDINQKPTYFGYTLRFGQAYQPDTNINGLNRFYPNDLEDVNAAFGDIGRIRARDNGIRCFQQKKVGLIPVYKEIVKDANGSNNLIVSDKLLNPINYYVGNNGIGTAYESLASTRFVDYFCDNFRGDICRLSDNGITVVSTEAKVNSWANDNIPLRTGNYKIYGSFFQRKNSYIVALEATDTSPAQTISFNETSNTFESFLSYHPEMMCSLDVLFITFLNGVTWTHDATYYNTFYGVSYPSYYMPVFNEFPLERKTFEAVQEVSNVVWYCPLIQTSLMSYGVVPQQSQLISSDFVQLEGGWNTSFYRDSNSNGGLINGDSLKGFYIFIKFQVDNPTTLITLALVSVYFINSPLNQK